MYREKLQRLCSNAKRAASLASSNEEKILRDHKISPKEYRTICELLGRKASFSEIGIFSALWNEHCSYKSSRVHLSRLPSEGKDVVYGPGENAGVIRLAGDLCVAFKMESHNHPSFIDPYEGAATGVGGILRDVFCMGARPIAILNALRFGQKNTQLSQWLQEGVIRGIGDYGNCVGIPTVGGSIAYDSSYDGNILVNAMAVGLLKEKEIFCSQARGVGNLLVYVGTATGRDGIQGAQMASGEFDSEQKEQRSAVQVGDPFHEKILLELTLEALKEGLVLGLQDMGAAGLTSSLFEMAEKGGCGLLVDLDEVPVRASRMTAYELMLSETQERMAMVITEDKWPRLKELCEKWKLPAAIIGELTEEQRVQVFYQGIKEIDCPLEGLKEKTPKLKRAIKKKEALSLSTKQNKKALNSIHLVEVLKEKLASLNYLYEQYDSQIGQRTVFGPREEGAALLRIAEANKDKNSYLGLALAASSQEKSCGKDPKLGASLSVLKVARTVAACGASPLALTDCLNYGSPEDPEVMWQFSQGVDGIAEASEALNIPVVSGNVSFYNQTDGKAILPTPMIGIVAKHEDIRQAFPAKSLKQGELFLLTPKKESCYQVGGLVEEKFLLADEQIKSAQLDWQAEKEAFSFLRELSLRDKNNSVFACRDVGEGGVLLTALKMAFAAQLGLVLEVKKSYHWLLSERLASYLLLLDENKKDCFMEETKNLSLLEVKRLGILSEEKIFQVEDELLKL